MQRDGGGKKGTEKTKESNGMATAVRILEN